MPHNGGKFSYTIPCSSAFRDRVADLARRRQVNVADLARSVVLMVPPEIVAAFPDPGGPGRDDREAVTLKSGPAKGRPWRRKPRLQVRMSPGYPLAMVRRALALALALDRGDMAVHVDEAAANNETMAPAEQILVRESHEEMERLRAIVSVLSFEPLADGVKSRDDALHVLGFSPGARPGLKALGTRFRRLASIHHPDGSYGDHQRMSQLNAAMEHLRRG